MDTSGLQTLGSQRPGCGLGHHIISETDVDRAILEGVTQTKEGWKVELRRDDTTGSKFRYLANVQVGEEQWTDQLVLGAHLIAMALACSPPERATSQLAGSNTTPWAGRT